MCFSASASFVASAVLVPAGVYCVKKAVSTPSILPLALLPLVFGIQQMFEGILWLGINSDDLALTRPASLGFTFLSHFFWLFWIPFAVYFTEGQVVKKRVFLIFTLVGVVFGASMYIPMVFNAEWLVIEVIKDSIVYKTTLIYDTFVPRIVIRLLYAAIILVPLLFSSKKEIRHFGWLIAVSVVLSTILFGYAFISVWCFFAAFLSLYVLYTVRAVKAWPS